MTKAKDQNLDPFARIKPSSRSQHSSSLGEAANFPDTHDEEMAAISDLVPKSATTDEGVARMMEIMNRAAPNDASVSSYGARRATLDSSPIHQVPQEEKSVFSKLNNDTQISTKTTNNQDKMFSKNDSETEKIVNENITSKLPNSDKAAESPSVNAEKPFEDEDVLPILDAMLTAGYARYEFNIRNATCTLRTQFFWEDQMVVDFTDTRIQDNTLRATGSFYFQVYSLAANLESFGGNYFKPIRQGTPEELRKSFQDRVDFLLTLPSVFVTYLFNKRTEFVEKLEFITKDFDRLVKVF